MNLTPIEFRKIYAVLEGTIYSNWNMVVGRGISENLLMYCL